MAQGGALRAAAPASSGRRPQHPGAGRGSPAMAGPAGPTARRVGRAPPAREAQRRPQHPGGGAGPHRCSRERIKRWRATAAAHAGHASRGVGSGAPAAGPRAAALASERWRLGMSCPWRKERSEAAGLGFQTAAHPFIRHQISSWPPDLDERSRFLRLRVFAGWAKWADCAFLGRTHEDVFGPVS